MKKRIANQHFAPVFQVSACVLWTVKEIFYLYFQSKQVHISDGHGLSRFGLGQSRAVMCTSHLCRVRITSPLSQSQLIFFRVESMSRYDLLESSQSRVTRTVESLRDVSLQARVNVESNEILSFSYVFFCYGA